MKQHNGMRPLNVAVLLKMIALGDGWLNKDLALALSISPFEISESLNRSRIAGLLDPAKKKVFRNALLEFIRYGLPYVFPVEPGPFVRSCCPNVAFSSHIVQLFSLDRKSTRLNSSN